MSASVDTWTLAVDGDAYAYVVQMELVRMSR